MFTDDSPGTSPMIPPEKPLKKEASKASKKKDKSKVQRPQTAEKKLPTSDSTEAAKTQGAETQSVPSQPAPSQLRTHWPEEPAPGTFSRCHRTVAKRRLAFISSDTHHQGIHSKA